MIKVEGLCKQYTINDSVTINALKNVDLKFPDTGFIVIAGRSGSGKTTLLNMLGGLDRPTSGSVFFNEKNLNMFKGKDYDYYRNYCASFIFQDYNLLSDYSVIDNIKLAVSFQENDKEVISKRASDALERVGLSELKVRKLKTLSGGQQQRVVIARALAKDASVILCDEPTGNLDSKTSEQIIETLKEIAKDRLVVVVTHDEEIAKSADRLVRLKDGEVFEDVQQRKTKHQPVKLEKEKERKSQGGIRLRESLSMVKHNLQHFAVTSTFVAILFVAMFVLLSVFTSLAQFDKHEAYAYTLKQNGQYVMQITKYIDKARVYPNFGELVTINGPQAEESKCRIEDIETLRNENPGVAFYPSYFFNKNFQDFTDGFILPSNMEFMFEAIGFREAVAVDDFATFHQGLSFGRKPVEDNEVLIYDYMAYCLIYHNVFSGSIESLVGKELTDKQTGLNLKISGIIKSDYEQYSYIKTSRERFDFEKTYLTSLQTIFCKPEFVKEVEKESYYSSLAKIAFIDNEKETMKDTAFKKFKYNAVPEDANYLAKMDGFETMSGPILSARQAADILGIDASEMTPEIAENFIKNMNARGYQVFYMYSYGTSGYSSFTLVIIGITDDEDEDNVVFYKERADHLTLMNSNFRQIYLSLTPDWKTNSKALSNLTWVEQSKEFYAENPDYYYEGYFDFNPYSLLVYDASVYLDNIRDFSFDILRILIAASVIGLLVFTVLTVRKYNYKIGVLKSLGAKNSDIGLIFGLQLLFIVLFAYLLSVPASLILMNQINSMFVSTINSNLTFFFINPMNLLWILLSAVALVCVSALIPILKLTLTQPTDILKKNNRR